MSDLLKLAEECVLFRKSLFNFDLDNEGVLDKAATALREAHETIKQTQDKLNNCHDEAQARALQIISMNGELKQLRAELDAAKEAFSIIENWCGLHRSIEIDYVVDGYNVSFTDQDGATTVKTIHCKALAALEGKHE